MMFAKGHFKDCRNRFMFGDWATFGGDAKNGKVCRPTVAMFAAASRVGIYGVD